MIVTNKFERHKNSDTFVKYLKEISSSLLIKSLLEIRSFVGTCFLSVKIYLFEQCSYQISSAFLRKLFDFGFVCCFFLRGMIISLGEERQILFQVFFKALFENKR